MRASTARPICLGPNVPTRGPRKHWNEAEKHVALEASLSASEPGPTKKEAHDGGLKGMEMPLRACRKSLQAVHALPLETPLRRGDGINRTKRGVALPPFVLCANMEEVVGDQDGRYGRDI
jgi:hypothetical protein